jgi:Spy/CpxP family protein refolding chaperone
MKLYWKHLALSLIIGFIAGAAAGALAARGLSARWLKSRPDMFLKRFGHELNLTDAQKPQIMAILTASREKMRSSREEIQLAARAEIRKILDSDQQKRFDAMEARRDAEFAKHRGRFGH